jgi:tRNA nucleotidyltransferase (CCA-adding enzyme)
MKTYVVGGAVRDRLLGLPVNDRDYVVVGSTPEEMAAAGFTPVGRDFPVFLHPQTYEEYALARTERKTAPGYGGFTFHADANVSLEEDLARRDLTINAMAEDEGGRVIDPFGGQADLADRMLRHVGAAFIEDPVRILRVARFAARFADFEVAPPTLELMRAMVKSGEVDALVPERVWQELSRGLCEAHPQRMLEVLDLTGAMSHIAPRLARVRETWPALERAAREGAALCVRFAVWIAEANLLLEDLPELVIRLKVPGDCRELCLLTLRERPQLSQALESSEATLALLERADALRRPERFEALLCALAILAGEARQAYLPAARLLRALAVARSVDAGAIARSVEAAQIASAVRAARLAALSELRAY